MADRRLGSLLGIVILVGVLVGVWWLDRTRHGPPQVVAASDGGAGGGTSAGPRAGTGAPPVPIPRSAGERRAIVHAELSWLDDGDERDAIVRTAALVDRGGPYDFVGDDDVYVDERKALPPRDAGYWRGYAVPVPAAEHADNHRLVAGARGELYYTRDAGRSFTALRGAAP